MPIVEIRSLRKTYRVAERRPGLWGAVASLVHRRYRSVVAIEDVSFQLEPGELVGYIGPNGAGKSTTVKVLAGILVPDSGTCRVLERTPWLDRIAHVAQIGVVFGQRTQLWWDLPVVESFDLLSAIYRVPAAAYRQRRQLLVEQLELGGLLDTPVRQLSLGQRMRCDLAAALLHGPRILFLDEPTIGLDAVAKLAVRDFIRQLNRQQETTVILTTHDMDDIEALCSRVMVLGSGRLLADGSLADLRRRVSQERRLIVDLADTDAVLDLPPARLLRRDGQRLEFAFDPAVLPAAELIRRAAAATPVRDLFVTPPPIEELVARLYREHAA